VNSMSSDTDWERRRAVEVHNETAEKFFAEYGAKSIFDSPFRYGRQLIDHSWVHCVSLLPAGGRCPDIGCGVGAHMARLLEQDFEVVGIEPSVEMRRLAETNVPAELEHRANSTFVEVSVGAFA
jgi:SAM-dependent methyltransferase